MVFVFLMLTIHGPNLVDVELSDANNIVVNNSFVHKPSMVP